MEPKANETTNAVLRDLIHRVDRVVAREKDEQKLAAQVGEALRPFLGRPGLLEPAQREPDPERYRQHILHVAEDGSYSIVALVWLPGRATSIHDHVTWCVVGVHEGFEKEVLYDRIIAGEESLLEVSSCVNPVGTVGALTPPGDIHLVVHPGPGTAISLHIYGADVRQLGTSIRRRYDLPIYEAEPARIAS